MTTSGEKRLLSQNYQWTIKIYLKCLKIHTYIFFNVKVCIKVMNNLDRFLINGRKKKLKDEIVLHPKCIQKYLKGSEKWWYWIYARWKTISYNLMDEVSCLLFKLTMLSFYYYLFWIWMAFYRRKNSVLLGIVLYIQISQDQNSFAYP